MTKSIFRGFFNIIMLTLTAVLLSVSFVACDEDNALNELNPNEKPVPMPTDDLLDVNKVVCRFCNRSKHQRKRIESVKGKSYGCFF